MKIITAEQIEKIMKLVYQGNVPVQIYDTIDKIFSALPEEQKTGNESTSN
jgi:hypothetical protein